MSTKPKTLKKTPALPTKTWEWSCKKCGGGDISCDASLDINLKGSLNDGGDFKLDSTNNIGYCTVKCAACGPIDVLVHAGSQHPFHDGQDYTADDALSQILEEKLFAIT